MSAIPNQLIDTEFTFFFSVPTHQIFVFFQANILFFWPKKNEHLDILIKTFIIYW